MRYSPVVAIKDVRMQVKDVEVRTTKDFVKVESKELASLLAVGDIFQAVTFINYRFQRRTFVVHAVNRETDEVACILLGQDAGSMKDASIQDDVAVITPKRIEDVN